MKKMYVKIIPIFLLFATFSFTVYKNNPLNEKDLPIVGIAKNNSIIETILKQNQTKEIVANKEYDGKFTYLAFKENDVFTSYFIDTETGEETELEYYLKPLKEQDFENKIQELLYLKYPKFLCELLLQKNVKRTYEIKDNELVIHFGPVQYKEYPVENLFLRVNYNEIQTMLDFTLQLDLEYENENGYHYDVNKPTIAFTFDDGPSGKRTNQIVDLLEENKAHATFFMVGNKMNHGEDVMHNVLEKGNEIGSHSYAHKNMKRSKVEDILISEKQTNEIYKKITGKDLLYTRPPYGAISNEVRDSLNTIFVTWNIDTEDWLHRNKTSIMNCVLNHVQDGDIVLMHDSYDSTVEAVSELLPILYLKGYQVVNVSELAMLKGKTLEQHIMYRNIRKS